MSYFAAFLKMKDPELSQKFRPDHLSYLEELEEKGKIFARGPLEDGTGGLVIYIADNFKEAKEMAENDPYIVHEARELSLHKWNMTTGK